MLPEQECVAVGVTEHSLLTPGRLGGRQLEDDAFGDELFVDRPDVVGGWSS